MTNKILYAFSTATAIMVAGLGCSNSNKNMAKNSTSSPSFSIDVKKSELPPHIRTFSYPKNKFLLSGNDYKKPTKESYARAEKILAEKRGPVLSFDGN